ncbi:MAG: anaerobic ribonucleoside-triphosphate reductase activating protein [Fusobacteriaceae bacterium]
MNYSGVKYSDMINGEGIRVSLFVSGCSHHCKDCFNSVTWDPKFGDIFTEEVENKILNYFEKYKNSLKGLSILGGDPTYHSNVPVLIKFVKRFNERFPEKNIWIWSGYTWEEIIEKDDLKSLISLCDVLVEGKFRLENKNLNLKWRGSSNQRVVDIQKSLHGNELVKYIN